MMDLIVKIYVPRMYMANTRVQWMKIRPETDDI